MIFAGGLEPTLSQATSYIFPALSGLLSPRRRVLRGDTETEQNILFLIGYITLIIIYSKMPYLAMEKCDKTHKSLHISLLTML